MTYFVFVNPDTMEVFKSKDLNDNVNSEKWSSTPGAQTLVKDYVDDNFKEVWVVYKKDTRFQLMAFVEDTNARDYCKFVKDEDVSLELFSCKS